MSFLGTREFGIQNIGVCGQHAVRVAGVDLQCRVAQQFGLKQRPILVRNDLIVVTCEYEGGHLNHLEVFGLIGL